MQKPLLSIIIPTYRRPSLLDRALKSCIPISKHIDLQIIVVDDDPIGSGSDPFLNATRGDHNASLTYVRKGRSEPRGVSTSRNHAIQVSTGEYILFLDDDDWVIAEGVLMLTRRALERRADLAVGSYLSACEEPSQETKEIRLTSRSIAMLPVVNTVPVGAYILRKESCRELFDTSINSHEDWLFLLDNLTSSTRISLINKPVVVISQRNDNPGRNLRSRRHWHEDFKYIYEKHPAHQLAAQRRDMLARIRDTTS